MRATMRTLDLQTIVICIYEAMFSTLTLSNLQHNCVTRLSLQKEVAVCSVRFSLRDFKLYRSKSSLEKFLNCMKNAVRTPRA